MAVVNTNSAPSDARLWDIAQRISRMANLLKAGLDIEEEALDQVDRGYLKFAQFLVERASSAPFAPNVIDARKRFVTKSEAVAPGA